LATGWFKHAQLWSAALLLQVILSGLTAQLPSEFGSQAVDLNDDPGFYGMVGMDPWYTYNMDPARHPNDVNRTFLERMMADIAALGVRWVRIELHPELETPSGPGPIDYTKTDWFINELAPKYGIKILAVMGSGLIGDNDPAWNFRHINDPLGENGSNYYIDMYLERLRETTQRYGSNIGAFELLNEPNASIVLHINTDGREKAVKPANYGVLLRRSYEITKSIDPDIDIVVGGMLYDTNYNSVPENKEYTFDLDWLEAVYGSRAVRSFYAAHGRYPFDAVAVHPYYLDPNGIIHYLNVVKGLQERFDDPDTPLWITEIGTAGHPPESMDVFGLNTPSPSEVQQASFLSSVYTTVRQRAPFVERVFWFKYEDFPDQGGYSGYGLVRLKGAPEDYGTFAEPWPRKLAYSVYQALAQPYRLPVAPVEPPEDLGTGAYYFTETGHTLREPFLSFWEHNGGAQMIGYPLTEPFEQSGRLVQYFERARLEHYPENAGTEWEVQFGRLGSFLVEGRSFERQPPGQGGDGKLYYPETGQYLQGLFLWFWQANGGLMRFGLPLSGEFTENGVIVQYFERTRFEYRWDPAAGEYVVVLGEIGSEILTRPGWYR
jgi:hypothetical protein